MTDKVRAFAQGCLDYLADIPEEKWCVAAELSVDHEGNEQRCGVGHLVGRQIYENMALKAVIESRRLMLYRAGLVNKIVLANDYGGAWRSPKERVINLLIDIVEGKR
jgi:hypothetical protein